MKSQDHELLTVQEVAAALRLTVRSVRRLLRDRAIRFTRLCPSGAGRGVIRISRADLDQFIAGGVVEVIDGLVRDVPATRAPAG
jgi:excisionase family DNA binding protein